ncbi:Inhibin beta chain [Trachymyrmex zeteki]|uniref:Inhibin beta chain n=1 Tax=Mycetomoellerius zeteki TaxID=64791 RepID=A0A151WYV9_9HYME|nr:Inhibin beta chain [Trachymyrmex zeteki]
MSWSGAGSNSWTNEPTDRTAGACSQIDARGSSWAPLFVYLLHPLYSLLTLLILVHSPLQARKGEKKSRRLCERREKPGADSRGGVALRRTGGKSTTRCTDLEMCDRRRTRNSSEAVRKSNYENVEHATQGHTLNGQPLLEFPMSSGEPALEPLRIKRATLWARVELKHAHHYQHHRHSQINQRNITLWVFRVHCGNTTHLRGKELGQHLEMVTSLVVNVGQLGWQKFDVTKVVSRWYTTNYSKDKLTLLVDCSGCGSHVHVSTFDGHSPHVIESSLNSKGDHDPDRPFLVVRTDPAAAKRVRRRAIECSGAIKGQCCKQRFYVSFSQLGWDDWIIAPQGLRANAYKYHYWYANTDFPDRYYANYCRGDCAAGHRTPDTFLNYYTHVIEEYRKMDRLAGMQPCCAPLKFSPMSLIYYGPDSNIIKRDLPKMVVDECGCP